MCDSNKAEILAVHRACKLISSKQCLMNRYIIIISDSKNAVSWINGDGFGLLDMVNFIFDIRQLLSSMGSLSIKFMPRGSNYLADSLAKVGSSSREECLEWGDL
ncbi:hypothetical protein Q3G72_010236 [Acer saccharum]|nr:hypothetical protein Q3G72_010236 [Acer saccharum]